MKDSLQSQGQEDPLEWEMAANSSILVWEIVWTDVSGGLQSMGSLSWTQLSERACVNCINTLHFKFLAVLNLI